MPQHFTGCIGTAAPRQGNHVAVSVKSGVGHMWVVSNIRVPFWYPLILGAVIYSLTNGSHDFENSPCVHNLASRSLNTSQIPGHS